MSSSISFRQNVLSYLRVTHNRYRNLHLYGKIVVWCWLAFYLAIIVFVVIMTPARIAQFLHDEAKKLSHTRFGWMLLAGAIIVVSFPPLIGHSTLATLCGFAYGIKGFFIASTASLIGSALAFIVLRTVFGVRLRKWSKTNVKWQALEEVVRAKGLPLIILVRASPFPPWVYSNTLFASIDSVTLWQFAFATVFTFPKLLLEVFIGSRMAPLSDGDNRSKMDPQTEILNIVSVCSGLIVAICASFIVYRSVQSHIRKLDGLPRQVDALAAEALEEAVDEHAPLLRSEPDTHT